MLSTVARDGVSLGMYLVVTLSRVNAMRLQLQANFKTKISLFLFDNSDLSAIVGRSNIPLEEIKGRAVVKFDEIIHFQIAQPYKYDSYVDYIEQVKQEAKDMAEHWNGECPKSIPMLPEKITIKTMEEREPFINKNNNFVLGLYNETGELAQFTLDKSILLASDNPLSVEKYYDLFDYNIDRIQDDYNVILLDPTEKVLHSQLNGARRYVSSTDISETVNNIIYDLKKRIDNPEGNYSKWIIVIPDIVSVFRSAGVLEQDFKLFVKEGGRYGITPVFIGYHQELIASYDSITKLTKQVVEQVYIGMRISDQDHTRYTFISNEPYTKVPEGFILERQNYYSVQIIEK